MKTLSTYLLLTLCLFTAYTVNAQNESSTNEFKTLLGDNVTHGGYGSFSVGYTKVGSYNAFSSGMKGAWIINHSIGIGIAGSGFITEELGITSDNNYSFVTGGHGGFLIEPIFFSNNSVHFTVPIIIGGGGVTYINEFQMHGDYQEYPYAYDSYFLFEPGVELEVNMVKFFRVAVGVSYRMTSDINLTTTILGEDVVILDKKDLNQFVVNLTFKFGKF